MLSLGARAEGFGNILRRQDEGLIDPEPMMADLDTLLAALKERPLDPRLDELEPRVWSRIAALRQPSPTSAWAWRTALAALMVSAGVLAAGANAANASPESSPFAIYSSYAPSTLLGDRQ